jgi:xylulokinase
VHTFCHAVPKKWHVMGVSQGAGLSLQWFRNQFMPGIEYPELTREAATSPTGSQGLFWLPYLMGERTPHLNASARGAWIGLTASHTRADMIRSIIEGVSYSQKDGLEIIEGMGVPIESVRLSGGGSKSTFWRQIIADVLSKPVVTLESQEGSAYGAAILALVGTGAYGTVEEACRTVIREVGRVSPRREETHSYGELHRIFQALYPALKPFYGRLP